MKLLYGFFVRTLANNYLFESLLPGSYSRLFFATKLILRNGVPRVVPATKHPVLVLPLLIMSSPPLKEKSGKIILPDVL